MFKRIHWFMRLETRKRKNRFTICPNRVHNRKLRRFISSLFQWQKCHPNWTWNAEASGSMTGRSYVETRVFCRIFWSRKTCSSTLFWWFGDCWTLVTQTTIGFGLLTHFVRVRRLVVFCKSNQTDAMQKWFASSNDRKRGTRTRNSSRVCCGVC